MKSTHYFKWSPLKNWRAHSRKCDSHLICDHDQRKIMELRRLWTPFPSKRNFAQGKGAMVEKQVTSPLGAVLSVFGLDFQPEREADGTRNRSRWNVCVAGRSPGLTPTWRFRFRFRNESLVEPGELGDTLLRYFASLGSESILASGLIIFVITTWLPCWVLSTTSTLTHHHDFHALSTSSLLFPLFPVLNSCTQPVPRALRGRYLEYLHFTDEEAGTEKWSNLPKVTH